MVRRKPPPDWTSLLLEEGSKGVICIRKRGQKLWQFPGGKRLSKDRDSRITAVRENREEAGIRLRVDRITLVGSSQEHNHHTHLPFRVDMFRISLTDSQLSSHFVLSKEGEEVGVFNWEQLNEMSKRGEFSPYHRMLAERFGMWRTS